MGRFKKNCRPDVCSNLAEFSEEILCKAPYCKNFPIQNIFFYSDIQTEFGNLQAFSRRSLYVNM